MRSIGLVQLAFLLVSWATSVAGELQPGQATAVRLDGSRVTGPLLGVNSERVLIGASAGRATSADLAANELLALELPDRRLTANSWPVLEFANGDRIAAEVVTTDEDVLKVRLGAAPLAVPLEVLRGIAFRRLEPDDGSAALLFREAGADDLVLLTNGDHLAGRLVALDELESILDTEGRELRVPRNRIAAIAFSPELIAPTVFAGPRQIVTTAGGSLTVRDLVRTEDGSWRAETTFGEPIHWPAVAVRRVQFAGGRKVFLSELEPSHVEFTPYLDRVWPVRFDRAVTGEPLMAGDVTHAKGIGVHSRCQITYDLAGEFVAFHAVAGLAESAGAIGSVEFAVEVDGREVLRTASVSRDDAPTRIENLDLTDAETLILTVDFGRNGNVRDRANWCDAILVRSREPANHAN